jgi:valyl-tRNA synthetase
VAELHATATEVNRSLERYRYDDAANAIYKFFWGCFCDWYLEIIKLNLDFSDTADRAKTAAALTTLVSVFEVSLRLLSPFMPFLTEEIWHALYDGKPPAKSIALMKYPLGEARYQMDSDENPAFAEKVALDFIDMNLLQSLISETRALRKEIGVEEKAAPPIEVSGRLEDALTDAGVFGPFRRNAEARSIVERLARISEIRFVEQIDDGVSKHSTPSFDVAVIYERTIDVAAERERLTKDIAKYEKGLSSAERQLGNESFLAKAPAHIVEGLKKQETETRLLLEKARAALENLKKEG